MFIKILPQAFNITRIYEVVGCKMSFFRKLFSREPQEITINSNEIEDWLNNTSSEILSDINNRIKGTHTDINNFKTKLKKSLAKLENAELINPNIPEREKHMMNGNRVNYVQKANLFLNEIELPEEYKKIELFTNDFEERITKFNQNTSRAYFILKNYFDKDMREIATNFKNIEKSIIELISVFNNDKIRQYKSLLSRIRELNQNQDESNELSKKINELEKELEEAKDKKILLEKKIETLKHSKDFKEFHDLEQQRKQVESGILELNQKLNNALKAFDKALRKYLHDTKNKLIAAYLDNPISALEHDKSFEFVVLLSR